MASLKYRDWTEIYQPILLGGETFIMPAAYTRKVKLQLLEDLKTLNICNNAGFDHSNVRRIPLGDIDSLVLRKELGAGAFSLRTRQKAYDLIAPNMEIRDRWVYAIRVAVEWGKHPLYDAILEVERQSTGITV